MTNLNLSSNNLTQLPAWVGQLTSLTHLDLTDNYLDHDEIEWIREALPDCNIESDYEDDDYYEGIRE